MRVLVTRPQPGADRTAARLSRLGHEVVVMPLFEASVTATINDLPLVAKIGGLIATSARAFGMFAQQPMPESDLLSTPVYAVGASTAQAARGAGFAHVVEGGGTAEALLSTLVADHAPVLGGADTHRSSVVEKPLIYLAGVPRTPVIEAGLSKHRIRHSVVECYQMSKISYSTDIVKTDFLSPSPEVVLFYSVNAARAFRELAGTETLDEAIESARFLCLSKAIADELPSAWQSRLTVATRPDEDSLLTSLAALG